MKILASLLALSPSSPLASPVQQDHAALHGLSHRLDRGVHGAGAGRAIAWRRALHEGDFG